MEEQQAIRRFNRAAKGLANLQNDWRMMEGYSMVVTDGEILLVDGYDPGTASGEVTGGKILARVGVSLHYQMDAINEV